MRNAYAAGIFILFCFLLVSGSVFAANYYIDPATGAIGNDGSAGSPWNTLAAAAGAKTFAAGDTVFLLSGYHGDVVLNGTYAQPAVFKAAAGQVPMLRTLDVNASGVVVDGLTVSLAANGEFAKATLVRLDGQRNILQNCTMYSIADASAWYLGHWNMYTSNAVSVNGANNTVRNNLIRNVDFGIQVGYDADSALVEYNTVDGFAGDGLRGLADYGTFQYNVVKNCYDVNANHDDAFQSWSYADGTVGAGVVYGIVLRGNIFINYEDPDQLFRGTLQGIGCFDGMFEGWRIENNVIFVDHWHGITLMGATDCVVINNTVGDLNNDTPGPPWIQLSNHKDGTPSTGVVRNNLCTSVSGSSPAVQIDHNIVSSQYDLFYADYAGRDFHLIEGCAAVDAGSDSLAPAVDIRGNARPFGAGVDCGAFEFGYSGIRPGIPVVNTSPLPGEVFCRPNPAVDGIMISVPGNGTVRVYTAAGRLAAELPVLVNRQAYWDARLADRGMYFIRFDDGAATGTGTVFLK